MQLKNKYPLTEIILLTAYGNIPDSVKAIKSGAFDYITKGDDNSKIIPLLYRAIEKAELAKRVHHLEKQLSQKYSFEKVIGQSKVIQNAIELAKKVAVIDTTVLITGETGTGKEVFAQSIHQESTRKNKNFVAINCSSFSKDLLESELFGHKAGAFSGAIKDHKGLLEEANHGTIFLDEIGELALDLQSKLLRVIETGEFYKVGESKLTQVDVRIITATNKDLQKEVADGNFREDLYYRISVFQIKLPSLRERVIDIEPLAIHFMQVFSTKINKKINRISDDCIQCLNQHEWKGNIRELKNIMERCIILATKNELTIDLLPADIQKSVGSEVRKENVSPFDLTIAEKNHIQKVLNYTNGNKTKTAELLGIALTTLYRKLSAYNIS
jgi:two-component system, NtrC family, response regulator